MKQIKMSCHERLEELYYHQPGELDHSEGSMTINKKTADTLQGQRLSFCFPEGSITLLNFSTPFISVQNHSGLSQIVNGSLHHLTTRKQRFTSVLRLISLKSGEFALCFAGFSVGSKFAKLTANLHDGDGVKHFCETLYHKVITVAISSYICLQMGG